MHVLLMKRSVDVIANCPIEFTLKNKKFGPYDKERTIDSQNMLQLFILFVRDLQILA